MNNILKQFRWMLTLLMVVASFGGWAQEKWCVYLTDKEGVTFDPHTYFSPKALERRVREGLPLDHVSDRPLRSDYVAGVTAMVDSVKMTSRWFNAVVVWAGPDQVNALQAMPFVKSVEPMDRIALVSDTTIKVSFLSDSDLAVRQVKYLGGPFLRKRGLSGKGVLVAVFDTGFPDVDTHPAFQHLRDRNGIKATYDFIKNNEKVYKHGSHGRMTLSNIGGVWAGRGDDEFVPLGLALDAEFLLARTEHDIREPFSEEENWLAAAEWADKNGADIISSSLGYTYKRYWPYEMDGTSFVSRAANMAAGKGILVVSAAGNDGDNKWGVICTPADADSVLTVGGTSPSTNTHISFSSFGPTADYRLKPNVCAFGQAAVASKNSYTNAYGTSFATPLLAGYAACLRQAYPDMPVMELFKKIERSGRLFPYYDYAHGYGVPHPALALDDLATPAPTFTMEVTEAFVSITLVNDSTSEAAKGGTSMTEITEDHAGPYLYFHVENDKGYIHSYRVVDLEGENTYTISRYSRGGFPATGIVRAHYNGYTESKTL